MTNSNILFAVVIGALCTSVQASGPVLTEQDLIYTNDQMLNFCIEDYLRIYAPHLLPNAESISHWAGFSSISPKILLTLMEHQSSIISIKSNEGMSCPFGALSDKVGFNEQLRDITNKLAELHYERSNHSDHHFSVLELLSSKYSNQPVLSSSINKLNESISRIYYRLFLAESH
jgi:LasA protease